MMWNLITKWAAGAWGYILVALGAIAGVLTIYKSGKSAGENAQAKETLKREAENVQTSNEVQREVSTSKPDSVRNKLRDKWSRD